MINELTGKGKKARDGLQATGSQVRGILSILDTVLATYNNLMPLPPPGQATTSHDAEDMGVREPQVGEHGKIRSAVGGVGERIEFRKGHLPFYIDFTLTASESEGLVHVEGCIVYGVRRTLCFAECVFPKSGKECENCDRIRRCDRFEDKPLVQFSVNRHGIIRSSGEQDDQWRIRENDNDGTIQDLHYRAVDDIWKDALNWTNENILP